MTVIGLHNAKHVCRTIVLFRRGPRGRALAEKVDGYLYAAGCLHASLMSISRVAQPRNGRLSVLCQAGSPYNRWDLSALENIQLSATNTSTRCPALPIFTLVISGN